MANSLKLSVREIETLRPILDCIFDQIYVIDVNGNVLMVNEAVKKANSSNTIIEGRNMKDLVSEGFTDNALCFDVIKNGKAAGRIFKEDQGHDLFSWCVPHYRDSKIDFVVCTEWDLKNLVYMRDLVIGKKLSENSEENLTPELAYYRNKNTKSDTFIGNSEEIKRTLRIAGRFARSCSTILVHGETGTGKELLAKYIYNNSERANGPFFAINCGTIPEQLFESELFGYEKGSFTGANASGHKGLFEVAHKGTLFLDEVAEIPISAQAKLLRTLQENEVLRVGGNMPIPVDVRVIAATNKNLQQLVAENRFREDLYYRLNVLQINMPALRDRKEDIPLLIDFISKRLNKRYKTEKTINPDDLELFLNYPWPGNVRELENLMERAFLITKERVIPRTVWILNLSNILNNKACFANARKEGRISLKEMVEAYERELILSYYPQYKNSRQFAELLGIDKSSVNRKLTKYNIK